MRHAAWWMLTHLGSAGYVLPVVLMLALGLWRAGQRQAVQVWGLGLGLAAGLTLASKLLFMGWGLGVAELDFTGCSGHTLLATAVLPVLAAALLTPAGGPARRWVALAGWGLAALVGVSRVVLGAHSVSEVLAGGLLGSLCSAWTLRHLQPTPAPLHLGWPLWLLLALAWWPQGSGHVSTHQIETRLALALSGHERPYTREQLRRRLVPTSTPVPAASSSVQDPPAGRP